MTSMTDDSFGMLLQSMDEYSNAGSKPVSATYDGVYEGVDDEGYHRVRFEGSDETIAVLDSSVAASEGDVVPVLIENGKASIVGNKSSPMATVHTVNEAVEPIMDEQASIRQDIAQTDHTAAIARKIAAEAAETAAATGQHFWDDDSGAHVTDVTKDEWKTAEDAGFIDQTDEKPYHNSLWNSLGMLFRRALTNLVSITKGAIAFFDGEGNQDTNIMAFFGRDSAQIGRSDLENLFMNGRMMSLRKNGVPYFHVGYRLQQDGYIHFTSKITHVGGMVAQSPITLYISLASPYIADSAIVTAHYTDVSPEDITDDCGIYVYNSVLTVELPWEDGPENGDYVDVAYKMQSMSYERVYLLGEMDHDDVIENHGQLSAAEGNGCKPYGNSTHAEGIKTFAGGRAAHSEGSTSKAYGDSSHAEGEACQAGDPDSYGEAGLGAHAEGDTTKALGWASHSEGGGTEASGDASHAEGDGTRTTGYSSHAEGTGTVAGSVAQHVQGKYNVADSNNVYAHIVGNGTSNNSRSNAHTLDWSGNAWYAGDVESATAGNLSDKVSASASTETATITGSEYTFVTEVGGSATTWHRRSLNAVWTWAKTKVAEMFAALTDVALLKGGTQLSASDDLDTLMDVGTYYVTGSSSAPQNAPVAGAVGKVIVEIPHGYPTSSIKAQRYIQYGSGTEWYRKYESSAWNPWRRVKVGSAADGSTASKNVLSLISSNTSGSAGQEITSATLYYYGRVAQLVATMKITSAMSAGTQYNVATLDSSIRPVARANAGVQDQRAFAQIYNGIIYVRPEVQLAAGSYAITSTYLLTGDLT